MEGRWRAGGGQVDLVKLHQLLAGVEQLAEGEWGVEVDLPAEAGHHLLPGARGQSRGGAVEP